MALEMAPGAAGEGTMPEGAVTILGPNEVEEGAMETIKEDAAKEEVFKIVGVMTLNPPLYLRNP